MFRRFVLAKMLMQNLFLSGNYYGDGIIQIKSNEKRIKLMMILTVDIFQRHYNKSP